jgi:hypothetical protein
MSAFLQSGRFYHGETPIFRVRFRPGAVIRDKRPLLGMRQFVVILRFQHSPLLGLLVFVLP